MANSVLTDSWKLGQFNANSVSNLPIAWHTFATLYGLLENSTYTAISDANKEGTVYENDTTYGPGLTPTNEITGTGYTARGQAATSVDATITSHVVKITCAAIVWTASTLTSTGIAFVNHQSTQAASPVVGYWDFGGSISSTSASFTVTPAGTGLITCT